MNEIKYQISAQWDHNTGGVDYFVVDLYVVGPPGVKLTANGQMVMTDEQLSDLKNKLSAEELFS